MKLSITQGLAPAVAIACLWTAPSVKAKTPHPQHQGPPVDLVIALDVSGSMDGLIGSAKQRLWDVVNEMGRAQPQPDLRVAILTYGNPQYGAAAGFVRIDQPFTRDLDAVNQTLFALQTNGGDEYVARAITRSIESLDWSRRTDGLRIIFVAGNESAFQDPQISIESAVQRSSRHDIVVNAIYCGGPQDGDATTWHRVAALSGGVYASIDQNAAAVAAIETPFDDQLLKLNGELNETYVAFGQSGDRYRENQLRQDEQVAGLSKPAMASRAVTKASGLYSAAEWDLVDATAAGEKLEEISAKDLPADMQDMTLDQRKEHVAKLSEKRQALRRQIADLDADRQEYIDKERARTEGEDGLDQALLDGLTRLGAERGLSFGRED